MRNPPKESMLVCGVMCFAALVFISDLFCKKIENHLYMSKVYTTGTDLFFIGGMATVHLLLLDIVQQ